MKRMLPAPLLSAAILALWLLLNRSVEPAQVLLGMIVALAAPLLAARLRPAPVRVRRPGRAMRLIVEVMRDVVVSNVQVAWGIASMSRKPPRSRFVSFPIELRNPNALAVLALITTIVPGTVWSELSADRSMLLLHVFDVEDEAAFIDHFKDRYERPLQEIFE